MTAIKKSLIASAGVVMVMGTFLSLIASGEARAATFTFTDIADTNTNNSNNSNFFNISIFSNYSPINNSGTVAFLAQLNAGGVGIFTGNGGSITTISTTGGRFLGFNDGLSINNSGTVAFSAGIGSAGSGVFTGNGSLIATIASSDNRFGSPSYPSINNNGTVAFTDLNLVKGGCGSFNTCFKSGVFSVKNGAVTTIAEFNRFNAFASPTINDAGTVAFIDNSGDTNNKILTSNGGQLTTIATTDGLFSFFNLINNTSINNNGTVAFTAGLKTGGAGIFASSGGSITTIVTSGGAFTGFARPSINNEGMVAFAAGLNGGGSGIFTGPDIVADKVIAIGDPLFNSTVNRLSFLPSLNDAGQVAFIAQLADGKQVVVRADPSTVPESSSILGLLAFGALGASSALNRFHKSNNSLGTKQVGTNKLSYVKRC